MAALFDDAAWSWSWGLKFVLVLCHRCVCCGVWSNRSWVRRSTRLLLTAAHNGGKRNGDEERIACPNRSTVRCNTPSDRLRNVWVFSYWPVFPASSFESLWNDTLFLVCAHLPQPRMFLQKWVGNTVNHYKSLCLFRAKNQEGIWLLEIYGRLFRSVHASVHSFTLLCIVNVLFLVLHDTCDPRDDSMES